MAITVKVESVDTARGEFVLVWNNDPALRLNYKIPRDQATQQPFTGVALKVALAQMGYAVIKEQEAAKNVNFTSFQEEYEDQTVDITTEMEELTALVEIQEVADVNLQSFQ